MCVDEMSTGVQRNDTQQYCTLEDTNAKSPFVQYSPNESSDWWTTIKTEITSPKDSWSSDSDSSQQTLIYGNGETISNSECSFNLSTVSEDITGKKKNKKSKDATAVNKPAQVVERRNARERRRVQAVNGAFQKLRKVVPIEENKSKRMSKVKTLQLAIDYINQLQNQLQLTAQRTNDDLLVDLFSEFQQQQQPSIKSEATDFQFRVPASYYSQLIGENNENRDTNVKSF